MNQYIRLLASLALCSSFSATAANWSDTQFHFNSGDVKNPFSQQSAQTQIYSVQHASGYDYGDNFFFIDFTKDDLDDGFNNNDFYGEWYSSFLMPKAWQPNVNSAMQSASFVAGINVSGDAKVIKYLPGVKLNWKASGFDFLSTTFTAYIDDSEGVAKGGAPTQSDSWMFDVAWGMPFNIAEHKFYFTGHVEYIASREDEFGNDVKGWILAQPAVRWDIGHALMGKEKQLMLGVEWQWWRNKLGTDVTESSPQLHLVWHF